MNTLQAGSACEAPALVLPTGPKCSSNQRFMKFCTKKKDSSGPRKLSRHRICFTDCNQLLRPRIGPGRPKPGQLSTQVLCTSTLGLARTEVTHVFFAQLSDLQKICEKREKFSCLIQHLRTSCLNDVKEHSLGVVKPVINKVITGCRRKLCKRKCFGEQTNPQHWFLLSVLACRRITGADLGSVTYHELQRGRR